MSSMDISASALSAQRLRLDLIANNLANAETTDVGTGENGEKIPYTRLQASFAANPESGGVVVEAVTPDARAHPQVYQPGHPDADANGIVTMPNVNPVEEMVDLVSATRSYEANVTALNAAKSMTRKALEIGRG